MLTEDKLDLRLNESLATPGYGFRINYLFLFTVATVIHGLQYGYRKAVFRLIQCRKAVEILEATRGVRANKVQVGTLTKAEGRVPLTRSQLSSAFMR